MICADLLHVCFPDEHGNIVRTSAILEDLSPSGACIQFECPIPVGCRIAIAHPNGELRGVVKYCTFWEIGYYVGLQFDEGCKWSPEDFQPEFSLDLEQLMSSSLAPKPDGKRGS
ncbi:MAG: hypothetical protein EXQ52_03215 [Bryobacterales bacterium]|nr:hypothetical protein [Bryobacterales bacterium]